MQGTKQYVKVEQRGIPRLYIVRSQLGHCLRRVCESMYRRVDSCVGKVVSCKIIVIKKTTRSFCHFTHHERNSYAPLDLRTNVANSNTNYFFHKDIMWLIILELGAYFLPKVVKF